jgi:hypothetical protein
MQGRLCAMAILVLVTSAVSATPDLGGQRGMLIGAGESQGLVSDLAFAQASCRPGYVRQKRLT